MVNALLSLLLSLNTMANRMVPVGTQLHIRLTCTVGTYASQVGSPVSAVLIAPVIANGETLLPAGVTLSGQVKTVRRVGLGIRHETAGLELEFDQLTMPDQSRISLSARVEEVDNGRERVTKNGFIHGIRSTGSLSYRVSGYLRTLLPWEPHAEIAEWAFKSIIGELPEPEIYYPAGVELTLASTGPLLIQEPAREEPTVHHLTEIENAEVNTLLAGLPEQTHDPLSDRPSDPTNVLLIGTEDQITTAFAAAGWTQASPVSLRQRIKWIRAAAELHGYRAGPMSSLLFRNAEPAMSWEKSLNDVSKRHHVRIWEAGEWQGQKLWIGAATRDIDFAYFRPGQKLTHRIDANIDQERDKVAYDLAFTTCSNLLDWTGRPDFPRVSKNGTGDLIITDTRVAVIGLRDCAAPRLSTESVDDAPLLRHGSRLQRFARREILSARNDVLRTNLYWRAFEGGRFVVSWARRRSQQHSLVEEMLSSARAAAPRQTASLALTHPK